MVRYLSVDPPPEQHIVFSLLHAYVFSKSRRGNLPSETLSKLLSIQRKLLIQRGSKPFPLDSPIARAFEAMRIQMLIVNKKWMVEGVSAFGPLVSPLSQFALLKFPSTFSLSLDPSDTYTSIYHVFTGSNRINRRFTYSYRSMAESYR